MFRGSLKLSVSTTIMGLRKVKFSLGYCSFIYSVQYESAAKAVRVALKRRPEQYLVAPLAVGYCNP